MWQPMKHFNHRVLAALCCLALVAPASATIITNGGFEMGTGTDAANWTQLEFPGAGVATTQRVGTEPYAGDWHLALEIAGAAGVGTKAEFQQLTALNSVTPGSAYDFSIYAKRAGDLGPGVVVQMEIQWLDSDGSNGGGVKGGTGVVNLAVTQAYQPFGFNQVLAAPDSDAALVQVRLVGGAFAGSDAVVYFDNAAMVVPEPAGLALLGLGAVAIVRRRR